MARDFAQGTLVRVLPEWTFDAEGGIYLVRPSARFTPARTEAFIEWIGEQRRLVERPRAGSREDRNVVMTVADPWG